LRLRGRTRGRMTNVEIWTESDIIKQIKSKRVWRGELKHLPRIGEWVTILDGWASDKVVSVDHFTYDGSVRITVDCDYEGAYPEV